MSTQVKTVYEIPQKDFDKLIERLDKLTELVNFQNKEKEESNPMYMTPKETAEVLNITVKTLTQWETLRKLVPKRNGKFKRYVKSDVYSLLK